jgi:hypothetical protein
MKKNIYTIIFSTIFMAPAVSFAMLSGTAGLLTAIQGLINPVISIIVGLGVVYFFWGMGQFILRAGEDKAREEGRQKMIWGIVAIFVMVSISGIIAFLGDATGIKTTGSSGGSGYSGSGCDLASGNCDVTP